MFRLLILLNTLIFPLTSMAAELTVRGSTTVLPILEKAPKAYQEIYPTVDLSIRGEGLGAGLMELLKGEADIAAISYIPTREDFNKFSDCDIYPMLFRIAYDSIIPVVHPSNPVKDLTQTQLHDIFPEGLRIGKR